jgi:hypothetical protein
MHNELSALRSGDVPTQTRLAQVHDTPPTPSPSPSPSPSLHLHLRPFIVDRRAPTAAAGPHDALAKMQANYRNYPQQHMAPARRGPGT